MGDIEFILNGEKTVYSGNASKRLLDALRDDFHLTGTKCGCKEGECGACSVIIGGKLMNSCLVAMGSVEGTEVVTIEGYSKTARFSALDKAYDSVSAVQCGFCMPGMILASECLLAENPHPTGDEIRIGISGNLCRCTGYNSIVKAIGLAAMAPGQPWSCTKHTVLHEESGLAIAGGNCDGDKHPKLKPDSLREALLLRKSPGLIPIAGGTDLMVEADENAVYLFLQNVPEMKNITEDEEYIRYGAACTFSQVIKSPLSPEILKEACLQLAAPAIRNAGTLGGNIANGSPKADSALIFMVTDSKLRLMSAGCERIMPIKDFYLGRNKTALSPDELIVEILLPKNGLSNYYYKKVGARNALAISRVSFAGVLEIKNGIIKNIATAFGAVSDVIIRPDATDRLLIGKTVEEARLIKEDYMEAINGQIIPIRGRVGAEYRKDVSMNLLRDFLETNGIL